MIASAGLLIEPAQRAGIKVPHDPDNYSADDYPHFHVLCIAQLGKAMNSWDEHWGNAKIVASIPDDEINLITIKQLVAKGFQCDELE